MHDAKRELVFEELNLVAGGQIADAGDVQAKEKERKDDEDANAGVEMGTGNITISCCNLNFGVDLKIDLFKFTIKPSNEIPFQNTSLLLPYNRL